MRGGSGHRQGDLGRNKLTVINYITFFLPLFVIIEVELENLLDVNMKVPVK